MRWLATFLVLAAVGSLVVSLASHEQPVVDPDGATVTELGVSEPEIVARDGITPIDRFDVAFVPDQVEPTFDEYDHMPWDDARLWLGLAIGFGVAGLATGVVALRRRA